jgi:putative hydrolase of the HAD superfamily
MRGVVTAALGYEAVVLDLFHTLVDPEEHRPGDFDRLAVAADIAQIDPDQLRDLWEKWTPRLLRTMTRPVDLIAAIAGRPLPENALAAIDCAIGRYQDAALLRPVAGTIEALGELGAAGLRLGLLSNAHERDVRAWERSPLAPFFDFAGFSCSLGSAKPERDAYEKVLEALQVDPRRAVFVGDGNGAELPGARVAGFARVICITGLALRSGLRTAEEMAVLAGDADLIVGELAELPGTLEAIGPD